MRIQSTKKYPTFLILFLVLILASCSTPSASPEESSASDPIPTDTSAPTLAPSDTPEPSPTPTPEPNKCRAIAPPPARNDVAIGFPRTDKGRLPSSGDVKAIVLFTDFSDSPALDTPEEAFSLISPGAVDFYDTVSYGRMNLVLEPHFEWLRMSSPSRQYEFTTFSGHATYIYEAMQLADESVDFFEADEVIVIANPRSTAYPTGPSFNAVDDVNGLYIDNTYIVNATTSGFDLNNWGFLWLNHEMGHNMGLPDLYLYNSSNQFRDVGGFSLMGNIDATAPEFFAWERWLLGWIDDDQVLCLDASQENIELSAVEVADGTKALAIKIASRLTLVVESRKAIGYDDGLVTTGVVAYMIDTGTESGFGPLTIFPVENPGDSRRTLAMGEGESFSYANITIDVIAAGPESDTINVTISE